jgi:hypothetical protein
MGYPIWTKEPITIRLLIKVVDVVDLRKHDDRCCMAASVVALTNCLRCGEFTVSAKSDGYLKRSDWQQSGDRCQIYLAKCKTDFFGRGHYIKCRTMKSKINPIFWMKFYADFNQVWTGDKDEALFVLSNRKPLDRKTLVEWVRNKARLVGYPGADNINGISFRRGGAQELRNLGYQLEDFGVLGRWLSMKTAARYVKLTDDVVDEFANAFDRAAEKVR